MPDGPRSLAYLGGGIVRWPLFALKGFFHGKFFVMYASYGWSLWRNFEVEKVFEAAYRSTLDRTALDLPLHGMSGQLYIGPRPIML